MIRRLRHLAALPLEVVWQIEWLLWDRPPRSERLLRYLGGA